MKQLILLPNNMNCKTAQGKLHTHLAGYIYAYGSNNYIKKNPAFSPTFPSYI